MLSAACFDFNISARAGPPDPQPPGLYCSMEWRDISEKEQLLQSGTHGRIDLPLLVKCASGMCIMAIITNEYKNKKILRHLLKSGMPPPDAPVCA